MDKLTSQQSRMVYVRICVEIDAEDLPPPTIEYIDENGIECIQDLLYEWMPKRCCKCKTFGHSCETTNKMQIPSVTQHTDKGVARSRRTTTQRQDKGKGKISEAPTEGLWQIVGTSGVRQKSDERDGGPVLKEAHSAEMEKIGLIGNPKMGTSMEKATIGGRSPKSPSKQPGITMVANETTQVTSPKLQGSSGNKFKILSDLRG